MKRLIIILLFLTACGRAPLPDADHLSSVETAGMDTGGTSPVYATDSAPADGATSVDTTPVSTPKLEVIVNTQYLGKALELIRGAQHEIELVQFEFVYGDAIAQLQAELAKAVTRGVKVHVLLDEEVDKTRASLPYLLKLGIDAKLDSPDKRTHTKLLLVDRRRALFGSSNWSDASLMKTNESNICIEDGRLGAALHQYFLSLWDHPGDDYRGAPVVAPGITIFFDREYEAALMERLGAAHTIDLQLYAARYYADDSASPSSQALTLTAEAAGRGNRVRAIIERSDYNDVGNAFNDVSSDFLRRAGADVKRDPLDRTSHAKILLTDQGVLFGSSNWGFKAFRQEHDLNAYITDSGAVAQFRRYYEQLWNAASR